MSQTSLIAVSVSSMWVALMIATCCSTPLLWSGYIIKPEFDFEKQDSTESVTPSPKFPAFNSGFQGIGAATIADIAAVSPHLADEITEGVVHSGLANATASAINKTHEIIKESRVAVQKAINATVEAVVNVTKPWYQFILDVQHEIEKGFHYFMIFLDVAVSLAILIVLILIIRKIYRCVRFVKGVTEDIPMHLLKKPYGKLPSQPTETVV